MTLNLLFVNASLTDGGSERAMSLVAQALARRGHKVTMVLVREKERTYSIDERIVVKQFRYSKKNKLWIALQRAYQIRKEVESGNYDFVISYMWDLNVATLISSIGLGARVVVSERSFPGTPTRRRLSRALENVAYRWAHKIVYQTQDAQSFCPAALRGRSVVVPNMVETVETEPYSGTRTRRVVSIGRLVAQKNFPLLLRAFAEFQRARPEWILEIYGKGELEGALKRLAHELGIVRSVVFVGYVNDISARIRDAGMFALASDFEGISNAMSEAMALGLPVVCTDCPAGGAALLIENHVSGMLVPVGSQGEFVNAMLEIAADHSLATRLSQGARQSVLRFEPDRLVTLWEEKVLQNRISN